jgi:hypothetical protein
LIRTEGQVCRRAFSNFLLTSIDYVYNNNGDAKSPDGSWVPRNLAVPPALAQPNGYPYPTVVFECGFTHENWGILIEHARTRAFSPTTSIQVWIGCKLYKTDRSYRCIWGKRRTAGHNMRIMKTSPRMSIDVPTTRLFRIPANLIYWGTQTPGHIQGDFVLRLDDIRLNVRPRMMS